MNFVLLHAETVSVSQRLCSCEGPWLMLRVACAFNIGNLY